MAAAWHFPAYYTSAAYIPEPEAAGPGHALLDEVKLLKRMARHAEDRESLSRLVSQVCDQSVPNGSAHLQVRRRGLGFCVCVLTLAELAACCQDPAVYGLLHVQQLIMMDQGHLSGEICLHAESISGPVRIVRCRGRWVSGPKAQNSGGRPGSSPIRAAIIVHIFFSNLC